MYSYSLEEIFRYFYKFLKRYFWIILLFGFLGGLLGFYQDRTKKPYYRAYIYVGTGLIRNYKTLEKYYTALVSDLSSLLSRINDKIYVRKYLNLTDTHFRSGMVSVEGKMRVSSRVMGPIKIIVETYDKKDFAKFKQGLLYYYSHYTPLRRLYARQQVFLDTLNQLNQKVKQILTHGKNLSLIDPTGLFDYYAMQFNFKEPLFYFVSDFSRPILINNSYKKIIVNSFLGILVGILIGFFLELKKLNS